MNLTISSGELMHLVIEDVWNNGHLDTADALFTRGYINHGGLIPDLVRGPEAVKLSVALYRSAFPSFHIAIDDLSMDEGAIVLRWVAHCAHPLTDRPSEGKGGLRGITRCRLSAGKIAESWTVWDSKIALVRWGAMTRKLTSVRNFSGTGTHEPRAANPNGSARGG